MNINNIMLKILNKIFVKHTLLLNSSSPLPDGDCSHSIVALSK